MTGALCDACGGEGELPWRHYGVGTISGVLGVTGDKDKHR